MRRMVELLHCLATAVLMLLTCELVAIARQLLASTIKRP